MQRDLQDPDKQAVHSYDNLNIRFTKIEQRLDNQTHFDSGCAATTFIIENPQLPLPNVEAFRTQWEEGVRNPISAYDIHKLDDLAADRIFGFNKWRVLDILLNTPKFDRDSYRSRNSPIFHRPTPVQQLPTGKQYVHTQYILDTAHIEEVSLEGNLRCLEEWFRQLNLSTDEAQKKLSHQKLWLWMGDQLTVSRIRSLQQLRARELNWWHRLEHLVPFFGWLHAQMAQEESIHKQHYATGTGGLKQAFDLLKRKGLNAAAVQGNFHQRVREAYYHVLEAHIRDIWEVIGDAEDISQLRKKTPEQLDELARRIVDEFASTRAYRQHTRKPPLQQDHVLQNQILLLRDLLDYVNLDDAMRTGDVGRMFDLMPRLLFRFHGGNNWKYTLEVLESLQGLLREFPPDFRAYVLYYCWLACTNDGESFVSMDMLQERNVRDIKSTFSVHGPYASWDYIKKISAAIPTLRKVKDHTEAEFNRFYRGKSHTSPEKERDVSKLHISYKNSDIHVYTPGRHLPQARKAKDFLANGSDILKLQGTIDRWAERRLTDRSKQEIWEDPEVALAQNADSDDDMYSDWDLPMQMD
ncbi:hypothetical protein BC629DRAFT_1595870 [Irpex lacteus]|nr:hypothetical protein BC629DRAFT_1595870 [Irpex lacteus]